MGFMCCLQGLSEGGRDEESAIEVATAFRRLDSQTAHGNDLLKAHDQRHASHLENKQFVHRAHSRS